VSWWVVALAWGGWAVAVAAALVLRRRMAVMADAEHELRGAATAIGLALERMARTGSTAELNWLVRVQLDRMTAGLADLAAARGARRTAGPGRPLGPGRPIEAGRLAQVLANVAGNAAEHGVGPVEVSARRGEGTVSLEVANRERPVAVRGSGRGIAIARRAARELGGRVRVESADGVTRAVVELPADSGPASSAAADRGVAGPDAAAPGTPDGAPSTRARSGSRPQHAAAPRAGDEVPDGGSRFPTGASPELAPDAGSRFSTGASPEPTPDPAPDGSPSTHARSGSRPHRAA
jgi:signal transduction histidine kinase